MQIILISHYRIAIRTLPSSLCLAHVTLSSLQLYLVLRLCSSPLIISSPASSWGYASHHSRRCQTMYIYLSHSSVDTTGYQVYRLTRSTSTGYWISNGIIMFYEDKVHLRQHRRDHSPEKCKIGKLTVKLPALSIHATNYMASRRRVLVICPLVSLCHYHDQPEPLSTRNFYCRVPIPGPAGWRM